MKLFLILVFLTAPLFADPIHQENFNLKSYESIQDLGKSTLESSCEDTSASPQRF